jgi:hypothetical protein
MCELTDYPSLEHFNRVKTEGADLIKRVTGMVEMMSKTEYVIASVGLLLNVSQPAADGKLGIRWWSDGRGKRGPVFVEWKRKRMGNRKFYPTKINSRVTQRQKRHSAFKVNEKPTEILLHFCVEAIRIRSILNNAFANISRMECSFVDNNKPTIDFQESKLKELGQMIRKNNERWELEKASGLVDWVK